MRTTVISILKGLKLLNILTQKRVWRPEHFSYLPSINLFSYSQVSIYFPKSQKHNLKKKSLTKAFQLNSTLLSSLYEPELRNIRYTPSAKRFRMHLNFARSMDLICIVLYIILMGASLLYELNLLNSPRIPAAKYGVVFRKAGRDLFFTMLPSSAVFLGVGIFFSPCGWRFTKKCFVKKKGAVFILLL